MKPKYNRAVSYCDGGGFIVAIIQDAQTKEVLMHAPMNEAAWDKTQQTGLVHVPSLARKTIVRKGELSGNEMEVVYQFLNCTGDAVVIGVRVKGDGLACHEGTKSCFFHLVPENNNCPACKAGELVKVTRKFLWPRVMNGSDDDLFWHCPKCDYSALTE